MQLARDNIWKLAGVLPEANPNVSVIITIITTWMTDQGGANSWVGFNAIVGDLETTLGFGLTQGWLGNFGTVRNLYKGI